MHLNEALNDQWIQYGDLPTLLVQVIRQGQVIGAGGFHHEPALRAAGLDQLLKARFIIADLQVFDQVIYLVTDGERGLAHVQADNGQRRGDNH